MADISEIILPNNAVYNIKDAYTRLQFSPNGNANRTNSILYGTVDSTSTATAYTATIEGLDKLVDGTTIMLHNGVVTSASGFTVNINNLGAKPCYNNMTNATRDTTIFNISYTMLFVYSTDLDDGNGGWWIYRGYDGNTNTIGYQLRTNSSNKVASDTGYRYRLWLTSADGSKWVPINTSTSTNATTVRTLNTRPIDPFGPIVYRTTNGTCTSGTGIEATSIWQQYVLNIGYSYMASKFSLSFPDSVYLRCTPQTDGSAIMQDIVQALPATKDEKIYIHLGTAYSATNMELQIEHPVYWHDGTGIRLWTGVAIPTKTSDLTNDSGFITSSDIPEGSAASTTTPKMDGTATPGTEMAFARGDHVHPTDTSRQATLVSGTNIKTVMGESVLGSGNIALPTASTSALGGVKIDGTSITISNGVISSSYTETDPTVPLWAKASTKPSYTASEVGALPDTTAIPTKVSDLTNDSGFITSYTETDPTVPAWAKASTKPTYTATEVGALPATTVIPTKVSDLTNDSGFISSYTETDPTVPNWAKATNKPTYTYSEVGAAAASHTHSAADLGIVNFTGATSEENGTSGLVPAPTATSSKQILLSNGNWTPLSTGVSADSNNDTLTVGITGDNSYLTYFTLWPATESQPGLMSTENVVALNGKVDKTGDTITGKLISKENNLDITNTPASNIYNGAIDFVDSNNVQLGNITRVSQSDGYYGISIGIYDSTLDVSNGVSFLLDSQGNKKITVNDAAAWRSALGVGTIGTKNSITADDLPTVPITKGGTGKTTATEAWTALGGGDIGKLDSLSAADIPNLAASKITSGTLGIARGGTGKATATEAWTALGGGDIGKLNSLSAANIPNLAASKITSGTLGVARGGTGKASHTLNSVLIGSSTATTSPVQNVATKSGAFYATAANGKPAFGTLPIAQGGTGTTSHHTTITSGSNVYVYAWGPVITVECSGLVKAPNHTGNILTIPALDGQATRPAHNVSAFVATADSTDTKARLYVTTDGEIRLGSLGTTASKTWYGTLTYIASS